MNITVDVKLEVRLITFHFLLAETYPDTPVYILQRRTQTLRRQICSSLFCKGINYKPTFIRVGEIFARFSRASSSACLLVHVNISPFVNFSIDRYNIFNLFKNGEPTKVDNNQLLLYFIHQVSARLTMINLDNTCRALNPQLILSKAFYFNNFYFVESFFTMQMVLIFSRQKIRFRKLEEY